MILSCSKCKHIAPAWVVASDTWRRMSAASSSSSSLSVEAIEQQFKLSGGEELLARFVESYAAELPQDTLAFLASWSQRELNKRNGGAMSAAPVSAATASSTPSTTVQPLTAETSSAPPVTVPTPPPLGGWASPKGKSPGPSATGNMQTAESSLYIPASDGRPPSSSSGRSQSIRSLGRVALVLAATISSKDVLCRCFEPALRDVALTPLATGSVLSDLLIYMQKKVEVLKLRNVTLVPHTNGDAAVGTSSSASAASSKIAVVYVDISDQVRLSHDLVCLAGISDVVVIAVSGTTGAADMAKKRDGELYNRAVLAHSLGIKRAVVVMTEWQALPEQTVQSVEFDVAQMMQKCGFDTDNVKSLRWGPGMRISDLTSTVTSLPTFPRPYYVRETATTFKVTVMVLLPAGITTGDFLTAFCCDIHMTCRVDSIPVLIDRKSSTAAQKNIASLRLNQVGTLELTVVNSSHVSYAALAAPFIALQGEKILAAGSVIDVESPVSDDDSDDDSVEDFDVDAKK